MGIGLSTDPHSIFLPNLGSSFRVAVELVALFDPEGFIEFGEI
jgi:hypothetical protein